MKTGALVCESYGATFAGRKLGTYGFVSNFSFYYAHHMSTIEGGMVSTNDRDFYEFIRMFRSHGMVRESTSDEIKERYRTNHSDLNPDFIFAFPGYNVRSTEINAVIGRSQLRRLDDNNKIRVANLNLFLGNLDPEKFQTDFAKSAFEAYVAELSKISELATAATKETYAPFKGRVQAWLDTVQSVRAS